MTKETTKFSLGTPHSSTSPHDFSFFLFNPFSRGGKNWNEPLIIIRQTIA